MKKIAGLFAALSLIICCFSCKDTNESDSGRKTDTAAEDMREDVSGSSSSDKGSSAAEPAVFRELTDVDFKDISISWSYTNADAPFKAQLYDVGSLDILNRIPANNTDDRNAAAQNLEIAINEALRELDSEMSDSGEPNYIHRDPYYYYNGCLYVREKYFTDNEATDEIEWAVFRYDLETGKNEEIYRWETGGDGKYYRIFEDDSNRAKFVGSKIFFTVIEGDKCCIDTFDLDTGKVRRVLSKPDFDGDIFSYHCNIFKRGDNIYMSLSCGDSTFAYIYNKETDTFDETDIKELETLMGSGYEGEVNKCIVKNDSYSFTSDEDYGSLIYSDDKGFILTDRYQIDSFDTEKMEHCVMQTTSLSNSMSFHDGYFFFSGEGVWCFKPDTGLIYTVVNGEDGERYSELRSDEGLAYTVSREDDPDNIKVCVIK